LKRRAQARKLVHFAEYLPILVLERILTFIPEYWAYRFAAFLAWIAFHVVRIRRADTLANLALAFPDLDEAARYGIAKRSYTNIGITFFEMLMIGRLRRDFDKRAVIMNRELIDQQLDKEAGLIMVTAHFGSWEMTGAALAFAGYPLTAMAKRQKNPYVDAFIHKQRQRLGMHIINHGAAIRRIVSALRDRGVIALVSDQDAGKKGVFVDFFGHPASTPPGGASMALRYNAPILVFLALRERPGYYTIILKDIPVLPDDTVESLVQRYTAVMETIIREHPDQYFWMHRRWKTKPPQHSPRRSEE